MVCSRSLFLPRSIGAHGSNDAIALPRRALPRKRQRRERAHLRQRPVLRPHPNARCPAPEAPVWWLGASPHIVTARVRPSESARCLLMRSVDSRTLRRQRRIAMGLRGSDLASARDTMPNAWLLLRRSAVGPGRRVSSRHGPSTRSPRQHADTLRARAKGYKDHRVARRRTRRCSPQLGGRRRIAPAAPHTLPRQGRVASETAPATHDQAPGGADRIRTGAWRFCRPLPYHLATAPCHLRTYHASP